MKVNPHGLTGASGTGQSAPAQGAERGHQTDNSKLGSVPEDRLELSSLATAISGAEAAGAAARAGYVKGLAKLYKSGEYVANAEAISRKLIQEALAAQVTFGGDDL